MKRYRFCLGVRGTIPVLKISAALKNPLFQMPSFGFSQSYSLGTSQHAAVPQRYSFSPRRACCTVFAFQASAQGAVRGGAWRGKRGRQGKTETGTSGVVRASPVTHITQSQLRGGRWDAGLSSVSLPFPGGSKVGLAPACHSRCKAQKTALCICCDARNHFDSSLKMLT